MCKSVAEGGVRCTYADQINNVRKKARYKHRGKYDVEREVKAAVRKWKEENRETVVEHLPESMPFQIKSSNKPVPPHLLELLSKSSRDTITGMSETDRVAATQQLYEESIEWKKTLTDEEERVVSNYAINAYELINRYLRRSGLADLFRTDPFYKETDWKDRCKRNTKSLDSAISKAPHAGEPRKVYRYFKVPAGVTPVEYMDKYFKKDAGFHEPAYMSTSTDPEFLLAHLHKNNNGKRNHNYIIMEILTSKGASLQPRAVSASGNIQSLEKEVVLPRNTKFKITATRRSQRFGFGSDRRDLNNHYYSSYGNSDRMYEQFGVFKQGDTMNFPVIQMVDESLL